MSKTMFAEADKLFYTSWKESSRSTETKFTQKRKGFSVVFINIIKVFGTETIFLLITNDCYCK